MDFQFENSNEEQFTRLRNLQTRESIKMFKFNLKLVYLITIFAISLILHMSPSHDGSGNFVAANKKGTDILFLKGKFILKDKKGAIVISDDKKPCHCPHYYR